MNLWVRHFGKIDQFWFDDFFLKKVTKSQKLRFDKKYILLYISSVD